MIPRFPHPAVAWVTPSARDAFLELWDLPVVPTGTVPAGTATLIACGGGKLLDAAKAVAKRRPEPLVLVAVPSAWGSGAEASPVVVLDRPDGTKDITTDPAQLPDDVVLWPALTESLSADQRRWGAADVWAHALEAIASPLGDVVLRAELAAVIDELGALDPVDGDAGAWLRLSGRSCALQARAGVGLAHGIAHVMEAQLPGWGHARIVAAVLPAVVRRTAAESPRWHDAAATHGLDGADIAARLETLTTPEDTETVLDALPAHWPAVLRNPCSRMNGYVVRRGEIDALRAATCETEAVR
jgi:alcohol dehydrogenase class IV